MAIERPSNETLPSSFATVARKIATWTTRGLLSAIVLVAGLGFGRQVLRWWAVDPTTKPPQTATADPLGDPTQLHAIEFGDSAWSMLRQSVVGDQQQAAKRLQALCRNTLEKANDSQAAKNEGNESKADDQKAARAAERLAASLERLEPAAQSPGHWRLYELNKAFPMAVGIAENPRRVILWGMALPAKAGDWTLCVFERREQRSASGRNADDIPLPPGAVRTLTLRTEGSAAVVAFSGGRSAEACRLFYDDWGEKNGWRRAGDWQSNEATWFAKYVAADSGGRAVDASVVDVRFRLDNRGQMSGLLMVFPAETD